MPSLSHNQPPTALSRRLPLWVRELLQWQHYKTGRLSGVRAHPSGRWEAYLRVPGYPPTYVGLFDSDISAAAAYDRALVRLNGSKADTNFRKSEYSHELAEHRALRRALRRNDPCAVEIKAAETPAFKWWIRDGTAAFPHLRPPV